MRVICNCSVLFISLAFLFEGICGFSQSLFIFSNYNPREGIDAPVFDGSGNRLSGENYVAMLYGGSTAEELTSALNFSEGYPPMPPVAFTFTPNGQTGYFANGAVIVPNVIPGVFCWLQVRAWDARLGSTYEEVAKLNLGGYGESNLFQDAGGPAEHLPLPGFMYHLQSFSLLPEVPEAHTACLLIIGLFLISGKMRCIIGR